jgi:hypothetical protein
MRDLPQIGALYSQVDSFFEDERTTARENADNQAVQRIEAKQIVNDQAYFVLCWGQLEAEIDDKCRTAIRARINRPNWEERRVWDLLNPDDKRLSGLSFEERATIVLDKNGGSGSPRARVMYYYALRNQIAHGTLTKTRIDVPGVIQEFYVIQSALQT